ncbi:ribbon-helix-helix protein, CopG family [Iamia sp. SCSIO 61187]|uniref:ribbon-helix-helix protein, CopG family n=1 Tax=Iamia sp. SCSIO 61187 TaxID=2722752 RepID=UPI001C63854E|nr:ribbon-helix-helix protein, CopG family [Iamia sp. SCSIO 61187]QYG95283.1 ribbon-helix-helix protein, CopG family [Iamia sp. SCSIO 61187]
MTLRLTDDETAALRRQAEREQRSMQDFAREAIREHIARRSRGDLIDAAIDDTLERYADALERLGR